MAKRVHPESEMVCPRPKRPPKNKVGKLLVFILECLSTRAGAILVLIAPLSQSSGCADEGGQLLGLF